MEPPKSNIMPIARSIANAVIPKREFGNPKTEACSDVATEVQLIKGFKLHGSSTSGLAISLITSKVNTKEAKKPIIEPIINMYGSDFLIVILVILYHKTSFYFSAHF